jgi:hypothetical protein
MGNPFMRMDMNVYFMRDEGLSAERNLNGFPSVGRLAEAKKLALRRRIWFKVLDRVERGIIDLTVRYVACIKSGKLAKLVTAIVEKLQLAAENSVERLVRSIGLPLARKISEIAVKWGNRLAFMWANDQSFAKFLVVNFAKL